jgi:ketosteroid isomerase-like protein
MPKRSTVEAFAAMVESGDYVGAIQKYYTADASMQENIDEPRKGRDVLAEGERKVMSRFKSIKARRLSPILIDGDVVVIHWHFEFTGLDGSSRSLDEVAWQKWRGEQIFEEQFFYDPKQIRG